MGAECERGPHRRLCQGRRRRPHRPRALVRREVRGREGRQARLWRHGGGRRTGCQAAGELQSAPTQDIAAACVRALKDNYSVPDKKIKVVVTSGLVKLEGQVEWQFQKNAAINAVRYLTGVVGVSDEFTVKAPVSPAPSRTRSRRRSSARRDRRPAGRRRGADGKVILHGHVRSWVEREERRRRPGRRRGLRRSKTRSRLCCSLSRPSIGRRSSRELLTPRVFPRGEM